MRTPYVTTWSLNLQQQIFSSGSLSVGYVGNHGTKLYSVTDINQVDPNSPAEIACGHCEQARRPYNSRFPFLGVINWLGYVKGSSVMTPPEPGTFGTMGRNLFRGPGYRNWDFSLIKTWTIRERFAIQFRGEFFNILNHPTNPFGVGGQLGNVDPSSPSSFGYASETPDVAAANPVMGSGGNRAIQLGLKFKF